MGFVDYGDEFEFGLDLILDGLERLLTMTDAARFDRSRIGVSGSSRRAEGHNQRRAASPRPPAATVSCVGRRD